MIHENISMKKSEEDSAYVIYAHTPLQYVKSVGPKRAEALASVGLHTVKDLLYYIPYGYIDRTSVQSIASIHHKFKKENDIFNSESMDIDEAISFKKEITIVATVQSIQEKSFGKQGRKMLIAKVSDESNAYAEIVFFNMVPYFKKVLQIGIVLGISGLPDYDEKWRKLTFQHPEIIILDTQDEQEFKKGVILPKYSINQAMKNAHISIKTMRSMFDIVFEYSESLIDESLPDSFLNAKSLMPKQKAIQALHKPLSTKELLDARNRMKFEELFFFQLFIALRKQGKKTSEQGIYIPSKSSLAKNLHQALPFELTKDQKKALWDIAHDFESGKPMNRLIQGDVGSGKTIVSLFAMLMAIDAGYQTMLMAPTETLAEQHFHSISTFLEPYHIHVTLLVGGQKTSLRKQVLSEIASGQAQIVIGTHALFASHGKDQLAGLSYHKLGLIIVDEQHRFGVMQRAQLKQLAKASLIESPQYHSLSPHILVMSATPIPRTLSMTLYGDLDSTTIKEMPIGRKPVKTEIVFDSTIDRAYQTIEQEIKAGRQAYIIYPLVEKSETIDAKSAIEHYESLKTDVFIDYSCGLLHGQMPWHEKERVMKAFKNKEYQILISTTVIEVGIDIPNATVMLIENAERFGLAQLHQLRGRVGRNDLQSMCFLATKDHFRFHINKQKSEDLHLERASAIARLTTMISTNDGFQIAEADMKLRGPGDIMGTRQSGIPKFLFIDLINDSEIIEHSKKTAEQIIEQDPQLRLPHHSVIRNEYERLRMSDTFFMNIA